MLMQIARILEMLEFQTQIGIQQLKNTVLPFLIISTYIRKLVAELMPYFLNKLFYS